MPDDMRNVHISMHKIPVGSGIGAAALIAMLLLGMALELPGVQPAVWGMGVGVIVGVAMILWRRHQKLSAQSDQLSASSRPR